MVKLGRSHCRYGAREAFSRRTASAAWAIRRPRSSSVRRRHQGQSRQSHLPGDGNHGVPEKWRLANAAAMANHASTRTTQLYDRRRDEMSLDEVERISI
jgi:hypothetical protein